MPDTLDFFRTKEDKLGEVADWQKKIQATTLEMQKQGTTKPYVFKDKAGHVQRVAPGQMTDAQKQDRRNTWLTLNQQKQDMTTELSKTENKPIALDRPQVERQLRLILGNDEEAATAVQDIFSAADAGDREKLFGLNAHLLDQARGREPGFDLSKVANLKGEKAPATDAAGPDISQLFSPGKADLSRLAVGLVKTLGDYADQQALMKGDTRGTLQVLQERGGALSGGDRFDIPASQSGAHPDVNASAGRPAGPGEQPTRAFTNIGTGGEIQEIFQDKDVIPVFRLKDGERGFIERSRFDPKKFQEVVEKQGPEPPRQLDQTQVSGQPLTRPSRSPAQVQRPVTPPSPLTGMPGEQTFNRGLQTIGLPRPTPLIQYPPDLPQQISRATGLPTNAQIGEAVTNTVGASLAQTPPIGPMLQTFDASRQFVAAQGGIPVRDKATGATFRIPKELFNPNLFEILPIGQRSAFTSPLGF